jgi:hypothetical protein
MLSYFFFKTRFLFFSVYYYYYLNRLFRLVFLWLFYVLVYNLIGYLFYSGCSVHYILDLVFAQEDDDIFMPRTVLYETFLDENRRQRFWNYLQDERRTIFDRYDPAYIRDSFHLAEKWGVLAQGRVEQVEEEEEVSLNYRIEDIFENTVWHPGYIADVVEPSELFSSMKRSISTFTQPVYNVLAPYMSTTNVIVVSVIVFVAGTTYIGYLAEQGHFDWLDAAQAEVDEELKIRLGILYDMCKDVFGRGGNDGAQPPQ